MSTLSAEAKKLTATARIFAISSNSNLIDRYTIIRNVEPEHWDFIISVAGIFAAISRLNHEDIIREDKKDLLDEITNAAIDKYPDYIEACKNCKDFVDKNYKILKESRKGQEYFSFSDSLGFWIVWNLFGHFPEQQDEANLVRPLGFLVVHAFFSWWDDK